jgi:lipopolysaccharide export system protein LptC
VFNSNGEQPWNIYADRGQARHGADIIQLWDNVRLLQAAGAKNQALTIKTSAMTIYPQQQYAETDQPITLWQPGGTASSVGLRAWQKTGIIELLSRAQGHYQNTPKK